MPYTTRFVSGRFSLDECVDWKELYGKDHFTKEQILIDSYFALSDMQEDIKRQLTTLRKQREV